MSALVLDTGGRITLPAGRIVPVEVAICGECGWRGPERQWSLFSWRAENDAERHNEAEHADPVER